MEWLHELLDKLFIFYASGVSGKILIYLITVTAIFYVVSVYIIPRSQWLERILERFIISKINSKPSEKTQEEATFCFTNKLTLVTFFFQIAAVVFFLGYLRITSFNGMAIGEISKAKSCHFEQMRVEKIRALQSYRFQYMILRAQYPEETYILDRFADGKPVKCENKL